MEGWLAEQLERIDRTFDFRYSVLPHVFAMLLRDRRLGEDDLHGLAQEKFDTHPFSITEIKKGQDAVCTLPFDFGILRVVFS